MMLRANRSTSTALPSSGFGMTRQSVEIGLPETLNVAVRKICQVLQAFVRLSRKLIDHPGHGVGFFGHIDGWVSPQYRVNQCCAGAGEADDEYGAFTSREGFVTRPGTDLKSVPGGEIRPPADMFSAIK